MTTANDVLAARTRLGWTQKRLAEALSDGGRSVTSRTIQNWESGASEPPGYLKLALERLVELHPPRGPGRPSKRRKA